MMMRTPSATDLQRMYYELGRLGARAVGAKCRWPYRPETPEALLALASDMSRHDPRLFEVLVAFWIRTWARWHPVRLRAQFVRMQTPQVFGVIGEFVCGVVDQSEPRHYFDYVLSGLRPVPPQLFFHLLYAPGSPQARQAAEEGVAEFVRWGFLALMRPVIAQAGKVTAGGYARRERLNMASRMLARDGQITMAQYRRVLQHAVTRQQAYLDLKALGLRRTGHGRGARWTQAL